MTTTDELARTMHDRALAEAVRRSAPQAGGDPARLLDSRALRDQLAALPLDGTDDHLVSAAVRTAVASDPARFAATPPPARSPAPAPAPAPGAPAPGAMPAGQWTDAQIEASTPDELVAAQDAGLLVSMGYGPRRSGRRHATR